MAKSLQKQYNRKRSAHPDDAHTKSKRWFKQKGRKSLRKHMKHDLEHGMKSQRIGSEPIPDGYPARYC